MIARLEGVMREPVERRLAAILAADVVAYSRLMGADEEGTLERLKGIRRQLIDPKIREHRGRIVKTTGDGILAEFPSVVDAVRCAVELQRAMVATHKFPRTNASFFAWGINLGDIIGDGDDIYSDGVNIAARLEALAEPGGICISRVVRDQIRDKLPYPFADMGEQRVKKHCQAGALLCTERGSSRDDAAGRKSAARSGACPFRSSSRHYCCRPSGRSDCDRSGGLVGDSASKFANAAGRGPRNGARAESRSYCRIPGSAPVYCRLAFREPVK
jgi:class 3 adenylate cyclase